MYFAGNSARAHPAKRCRPFEFDGVKQFVDKCIKFGHIGGFSAACAERPRPPPGALALPIEVLKAEAGGRGQRAEGRGRGAHTPAQPEPTRSRSCELEFPTFLTLFLLLHSDILAQGMVHAAAIAGHAETERAPCCLPSCLGGFSAAIILRLDGV